uniref:Uncharacterized protein n=1 Tax=Rhipicephalus zambeziensis TaxID=60191 RepID=A0A224YJI6_9ACAR
MKGDERFCSVMNFFFHGANTSATSVDASLPEGAGGGAGLLLLGRREQTAFGRRSHHVIGNGALSGAAEELRVALPRATQKFGVSFSWTAQEFGVSLAGTAQELGEPFAGPRPVVAQYPIQVMAVAAAPRERAVAGVQLLQASAECAVWMCWVVLTEPYKIVLCPSFTRPAKSRTRHVSSARGTRSPCAWAAGRRAKNACPGTRSRFASAWPRPPRPPPWPGRGRRHRRCRKRRRRSG